MLPRGPKGEDPDSFLENKKSEKRNHTVVH